MRCFFVIAMLMLTISSGAQNRSVDFEESDFARALQKAQNLDRLLFIDCYTDWCGPCKMLARDVFTNDEVADYMNGNFVSLKVDCEKGEGPEIAKRYGVFGYPTLLFIGGDGELIHKMVGATTADLFIKKVQEGLDAENSPSAKLKKFRAGNRDVPLMVGLFKDMTNVRDNKMAVEVGNAILETVPSDQLFTEDMWNVVSYYFISGYGNQWWNFIIDNSDRWAEVVGKKKVSDKIGQTLHPYVFGYAVGSRTLSDPGELAAIKGIVDRYDPNMKDTLLSFLRLAETRSFGTFDKYFKVVMQEYREGLPLDEHYRILSNIFDYLLKNSNKRQKKELEKMVRASYELQNDYMKETYDKFFTRFDS